MAFALLFQLRTYSLLRARLAACLVMAFLAIGMLDVVAYRGATPRPLGTSQVTTVRGAFALGALTSPGTPAQLRQMGRQRMVSARPPRLEEIHAVAQAIDWPDLEKGAPNLPRITIRKIPSDENADGEDAERHAPSTGYSSRAPPILA